MDYNVTVIYGLMMVGVKGEAAAILENADSLKEGDEAAFILNLRIKYFYFKKW